MADWESPYAILGISPGADPVEITEHTSDLVAEALTDDEAQRHIRAREQLTQHPCTRACHVLLEPPDAEYDHGEWDRLRRAFRRGPFTVGKLSRQAPEQWPSDAFSIDALIDIAMRGVFPPRPTCPPAGPVIVAPPRPSPPLSARDLL